MSQLAASGLLALTHTSSIDLVSFWRGEGRRIWQCAETWSLVAVLVPLVRLTAWNLCVDSLAALVKQYQAARFCSREEAEAWCLLC